MICYIILVSNILSVVRYAFVEFDDYRDAEDAVYDLHGTDFMGDRVTVEVAKGTPHGRDKDRWGSGGGGRSGRGARSRGRDRRGGGRGGDRPVWLDKYGPPTRTDYRVIVENLSSRVSWQDLKDFMRSAGEVTYADAHKNRKNEGVVEFARYEDVQNAIDKLDDSELNGRRIKIVDDSSKKRKSSRSRSRSRRSRSRSRSRSRRGRSRSGSDRRSRSRSRRDESPKKERSRSKSRSRDKSRSRSAKDEKERSRSASGSRDRDMKSRSKSRSRSGSQ